MAISTSFTRVKQEFDKSGWKSIDEYEHYFLQRISETTADRNYYTDKDGIERGIPFVDHFPELKEYEVWAEGYAATGERSGATLQGTAFARNFAQACDIVMCQNRLHRVAIDNHPNNKEYYSPRKWDYDPHRLSIWGCGLYWSKELASRSFG